MASVDCSTWDASRSNTDGLLARRLAGGLPLTDPTTASAGAERRDGCREEPGFAGAFSEVDGSGTTGEGSGAEEVSIGGLDPKATTDFCGASAACLRCTRGKISSPQVTAAATGHRRRQPRSQLVRLGTAFKTGATSSCACCARNTICLQSGHSAR